MKKRDKMCSYFEHMDQLFGGRQNVVPSYVYETGRKTLENLQEVDSDSDLEGEANELEQEDEERYALDFRNETEQELHEQQEEEEQQEALAELTVADYIPVATNKAKRQKVNQNPATITVELKALSQNTVSSLSQPSDLTRVVSSNKPHKKDSFSTAYVIAKEKELDLKMKESCREQEIMTLKLEIKKADQDLRREKHQDEMKLKILEKKEKLAQRAFEKKEKLSHRELEIKEETKRQVIQACIAKGVPVAEMNEILANIF